jgi:hypothetical protein
MLFVVLWIFFILTTFFVFRLLWECNQILAEMCCKAGKRLIVKLWEELKVKLVISRVCSIQMFLCVSLFWIFLVV